MMGVFFNTKCLQNRVFCIEQVPRQKKVLKGTFWKIRRIQIEIYPETSMEPKYEAFYLDNKVRVHGLVLLVQPR